MDIMELGAIGELVGGVAILGVELLVEPQEVRGDRTKSYLLRLCHRLEFTDSLEPDSCFLFCFADRLDNSLKTLTEIEDRVEMVRGLSSLPVGVGFGIRDVATASRVGGFADAIIVGSVIVERLAANAEEPIISTGTSGRRWCPRTRRGATWRGGCCGARCISAGDGWVSRSRSWPISQRR